MKSLPCQFLLTGLLLATGLHAQGPGPGRGQAPDGAGPWDHDLQLYRSRDGLRFGAAEQFVARAGVPSIIRDGSGRLLAAFQWFPTDNRPAFDRIAVKISTDDGREWSRPEAITVRNLPEDYHRPCDPTLVLLEDGQMRVYFTSHPGRETPATYSAISKDGIHYDFEPGARFGVEGETVLDCAVTRLGKAWHYFAPVQRHRGEAYHAVSDDGLKFNQLPNLSLDGAGDWLGCAVATGEGLRFYGSSAGGWSAWSRDGAKWELDPGGRRGGADPGVVRVADDNYIMIATGPSARQGTGAGREGPARERGPREDFQRDGAVREGPTREGAAREPDFRPTTQPLQSGIASNGRYVFVLRGEFLYQYEAETLELLKTQRLPAGRR